MDHVGRFLSLDKVPALSRHVSRSLAESVMVLFPAFAIEDRICLGQWDKLELGSLDIYVKRKIHTIIATIQGLSV